MGPPRTTPRSRNMKCLLCRSDVDADVPNRKLKIRCAISICTIFGLPEKHPFKFIYENAHYCKECFDEVKEADETLGKLEILKQSLLRFQDKVYSKLGYNYFQIENRDEFKISHKEFENGGDAVKGKKFSYDEIIKIIYEKLDQECFRWERFSSENPENPSYNPNKGKADVDVGTKADACCQTNNDVIIVEAISEANITSASVVNSEGEAVILPNVDEQNDAAASWNFDTANDNDCSMVESNTCIDPLASSSVTYTTTTLAYQPTIAEVTVQDLFTQPPTNYNFEKTISCTYDPECKRTFFDEYNLQIHIRSFHEGNEKPHVCMTCNKAFTEENRLKTHFLRVHSEGGSFMCEHCGKGYAQRSLLKDHVRKMHTNKQQEPTPCPFCGANFDTQKALKEHEDLHRAKKSPFDCVFCDEPQPNSTVAKEHYLTKHSQSMFRCDQCFKVLSTSASLKSHMKLHTDRFKCDECSYVGSSQSGLKTHKMSHSNEKPHTCHICGTAYKYSKNLTAHLRSHTGEKPYICNFCGAAFREHSYLKRHEESHSSECLYECLSETCGKRFKTKESLKKHHRSVHLGIKKRRKPGELEESTTLKKRRKKTESAVKTEDCEELVRKIRKKVQNKLKSKRKGLKSGRSPPPRKLKKKKVRGMKHVKSKKTKCDGEEPITDTNETKIETGKCEENAKVEADDQQHELNNAVASIEVPTASLFSSAGVVYATTSNHYEIQQGGVYELVSVPTPVAVVSTSQGVNVVRTAQGEPGRLLTVQFKYT